MRVPAVIVAVWLAFIVLLHLLAARADDRTQQMRQDCIARGGEFIDLPRSSTKLCLKPGTLVR